MAINRKEGGEVHQFDSWYRRYREEKANGRNWNGGHAIAKEAWKAAITAAVDIVDDVGFAAVLRTDAQNCCGEIAVRVEQLKKDGK